MLKKYKNSFLEIIQQEQLNPELFSVSEESNENFQIFCIQYLNTPFYFKTKNYLNGYHRFEYSLICFDAQYSKVNFSIRSKDNFYDINDIYNVFRNWLNDHIKEFLDELLQPDLWTQIENQRKLSLNFEYNENDKSYFSEEKKVLLHQGINTFRYLIISNLNPNSDEIKIIDERLNYLIESLDRLNRFDWKSLLITTIMSISIALSLDTEKGKYFYDLLKQSLAIGLTFLK